MQQPEKEKKEARMDGARLQPNSGRGKHKGDAVLGDWLIDYKHNSKSFSITSKNWKKMKKDAWDESRREPVYKVVLDGDIRLAVIEWEHFFEYLRLLKEENDRRVSG